MYICILIFVITLFVEDPGQQPVTVESSGSSINTSVTFIPFLNSSMLIAQFAINDDEVGLETNEVYSIQLASATPSFNVNLGGSSIIEIVDDDGNCVILYVCSYTYVYIWPNIKETYRDINVPKYYVFL